MHLHGPPTFQVSRCTESHDTTERYFSSSGSSRSWADTVKGLKAPRSVEDLTKNNKAGPNAEAAKTSNTSTSGNLNQNEDEDGWETVRPRARSKYSPVSECSSGKRPPRVSESTLLGVP